VGVVGDKADDQGAQRFEDQAAEQQRQRDLRHRDAELLGVHVGQDGNPRSLHQRDRRGHGREGQALLPGNGGGRARTHGALWGRS
jgi:hypothetical protein